MDAYLLIHTEMGRMGEVAARVATMDGVVSAETVTGCYDVVARASRDCEHDLVGCLERDIASIPGVIRVMACPLAPPDRAWERGTQPARAPVAV